MSFIVHAGKRVCPLAQEDRNIKQQLRDIMPDTDEETPISRYIIKFMYVHVYTTNNC